MRAADGPEGEGRDARSHRRIRPPPLSARYTKRRFGSARGGIKFRRDCSSHLWDSPLRAARCRASLRLSVMFRTILSTAEAGCRSEHRRSRWPAGRRAGCPESPLVRPPPLSARYAKRRFGSARGGIKFRRDCSSHPWDSPLRAARCRASLRLSKFVPDEFVDCGGRMPERTSAQPMARRAKGRMPGVTVSSSTTISPPDTQNALLMSARRHQVPEGLFVPSMGLTPSRCALRGQPAAVQIRSGRICRTQEASSTTISPPDTQNAPDGALCVSGGERGSGSTPQPDKPLQRPASSEV